MWIQKEIILSAKTKGFHIITNEILSEISELDKIDVGICHFFIQHTSASLTINENTDSSVRNDFEKFIDLLVPEEQPYFQHNYEGPDDMPAHIKASLLSTHISVPIKNGHLNLGQWQGIYLCEFRNNGPKRKIAATIFGQTIR